MASRSRAKGFVLTFVLLVLIAWFNYDFLSTGIQAHVSKFELSTPLSDDATAHVGVQHTVPSLSAGLKALGEPTYLPTPSTSIISPVQTDSLQIHTPELLTSPSDVLLIFKSGASTIWRRMPVHLITTLSNGRVPNNVIYSDLREHLSSGFESIDTLANVSDIIHSQDPSAYSSYLEFQSPRGINTYQEHALLPGDEPLDALTGNAPGWLLDKYKFLPMLTHAQRNWPDLKWYIYIEDDTFIFWNNIRQWLSTLSPDDEPVYYGAYSGEGNATFAQGGSGIVFSRSLMRSVFGGNNIPDLHKYGNLSSNACCGDIALGLILKDYGISVNKGEYGTGSFRSEPPWKTGFDELIWCTPVFTFHHLHQRDLAQLFELERKNEESSSSRRPVLFRDVFMTVIAPHLVNESLTNWDNFASRYVLSANSTTFPTELRELNSTAFAGAFKSPSMCQNACLAFDTCLSWRHDSTPGTCALSTVATLGREIDPQPAWAAKTEVTSGWMLERIETRLLAERCDVVKEP